MELAFKLDEKINDSDEELSPGLESIAPVHNSLEEALKLNNAKGSDKLNFYVQRSKVWKQVLCEVQDNPVETR